MSLVLHSGDDVLNIAEKPLGYRVRKPWDCRCESKMFAEPAENFPAGVHSCDICVSPVPVSGCCENCFEFQLPELSSGEETLINGATVHVWKNEWASCVLRGSAIDKSIFIDASPPYPVVSATVTETSVDNQLTITIAYGPTSYTAIYKLLKKLSCSGKIVELASQTQTTDGVTTTSSVNWPDKIQIKGIDCGFIPDDNDDNCVCDTMCVDFAGFDSAPGRTGLICHYTADPYGPWSGPAFALGTKVKLGVGGCAPLWTGGNLPGISMIVHQVGVASATLQISVDAGDFTYSCGTYIGYYTCDQFSCSKGGTFTFARATNQWIGYAEDTTSEWPESVAVLPEADC